MTRSLFSRAIAFAAAACLAVAHAVHAGYVYVCSAFADCAVRLGRPEHQAAHRAIEPRKTLVSAKAFRERMAKRERPTVTERWRMCPSA